ncbi:MAG: hypothetical protein PT120_02965 [Aphanizomenon gracile PMC649.10]|uniref:hypothetical protein n=1 Tax=Dolichospermum sp. UHCC 0315A TaxID=1914871 RepID=UPI001AF01CE5|nr:hypothetical protein [Dolichospermum sp. UHCC 0315A]MDM3853899.1 hypothetical protein [Aphanizomenon gracile PMC649.10]
MFDQQYFLYKQLSTYQAIANLDLVIGDRQQSAWNKTENLMRWINTVSEEGNNLKDRDKINRYRR